MTRNTRTQHPPYTYRNTQFYVEKNMQTPKLSLRFWGLMINGWSKLYVPSKSSQWKISLPIAIQANVCSSQSRTSLVLEVLVAERFFAKHTEKLLLICRQVFESAGRNELWLFLECIGIPYCFAHLLIYCFYLNTGKKNVGGVLKNFLFWIPHFMKHSS